MHKKFFVISNTWIGGLLFLLVITSCKKSEDPLRNTDASLSLYNASEYLQSAVNNGRRIQILIDSPGTSYSFHGDSAYYHPSFGSSPFQYQFPNEFYNSTLSHPWIKYMRMYPGAHSISLMDNDSRRSLTITSAGLRTDVPTSVYFADSLGNFRSWVTIDTLTRIDSAIRLRVLDLSPDAGSVFFTIDGHPATGFPDSLQYGRITNFLPWHNAASGKLLIQFFNTTDSTTILAGSFLDAAPGHTYNILLRGYKKGQICNDPVSGRPLRFSPDLVVTITQNF